MRNRQLEHYFSTLLGDCTYPSNPNQLIFDCSLCGKHKLYVYLNTMTSYCFHCGILTKYDNEEQAAISVDRLKDKNIAQVLSPYRLVGIEIPQFYFDLLKSKEVGDFDHYMEYLSGRGFSEYDVARNNLRFGWMKSPLTRDKIFLPIVMNGDLVYYQIRNIGPGGMRYLNPVADNIANKKTTVLFNFDSAKLSDTVIVTEGIFDAMTVGVSAVATMGKTLSVEQVGVLTRYWSTIILALDPDAYNETAVLFKKLQSMGKNVKILDIGQYKDINDAGRKYVLTKLFELDDKKYSTLDYLKFKLNSAMNTLKPPKL